MPGDVQRVVMEDAPEEHYRNRFLATAMFNLKMVDTAGGGIRKLFMFQKQRFFPMPDYDLSGNRVQLTLTGKVLEMDYAGLIEGRKPNYFIAKSLAQQTGQKASYSKNLAFDKQYYLDLICKAVKEHGSLARKDIDELLWNKLPDWMSDKQRKAKVGNLLSELRRGGSIVNQGSFGHPAWALLNTPDQRDPMRQIQRRKKKTTTDQ